MLGCGGGKGDVRRSVGGVKKCWGRCGKVCWDVGTCWGGAGKCVGKSDERCGKVCWDVGR